MTALEDDEKEYYTPAFMREWLDDERNNVTKAAETRLKEAEEFVAAYEAGTITKEQANRKLEEHLDAWPSPWPLPESRIDLKASTMTWTHRGKLIKRDQLSGDKNLPGPAER